MFTSDEEVAMKITCGFEGTSYDTVAGNFDGQGISAGLLQWNLGQGTLQELLMKYGPIAGFPEDISGLSGMSPSEAVAFSDRMQASGHLLPDWKAAWKKLLQDPRMQEIQQEFAEIKFDKARKMMSHWNLNSRRALCFFFDIAVQNGSMSGVQPGMPSEVELRSIIGDRSDTPTTEQRQLAKAAYDRSELASHQWRKDILDRKLTIVFGSGVVHGQEYDFTGLFSELAAISEPA